MVDRLPSWLAIAVILMISGPSQAHHVLGRPAYSLSGDGSTPSAAQLELQVGSYFVTMMAFPGIIRPGEPGRIKLYAMHIETGERLDVPVTFQARDDGWLPADPETLGTQGAVDLVYTQDFLFRDAGDYLLSAVFEAGGEPYRVDFPLRVGTPVPWPTLGAAGLAIAAALGGAAVVQRRRRAA